MASSRVRTTVNQQGQRTNSLGFAKHDCHTCSALKRDCDRQRPRCGPCLLSQQRCGGFATNLVWKDVEIPGPVEDLSVGSGTGSPNARVKRCQKEPGRKNRGFKFVKGRMKRKRDTRATASQLQLLSAAIEIGGSNLNSQSTQPVIHLSPWFDDQESIFDLSTRREEGFDATCSYYDRPASEPSLPDDNHIFHGTTSDSSWSDSPLSSSAASLTPTVVSPMLNPFEKVNSAILEDDGRFIGNRSAIPLSPPSSGFSAFSVEDYDDQETVESQNPFSFGVRYRISAQKYEPILEMYDREFCMFPLTMDCLINPFRVRTSRAEESDFLLHAIMAVSSQHLAKKTNRAELSLQVQNHRSRAMHLFTQALCQSNPYTLLDALLILVSLDLTQSAFGTWGIHLDGARRLLEAAKALEICQSSDRIRAQIAFLVWWDVTLSFLSREDLRLPLTYLEMLLKCGDSPGCSFFVLHGCSIELVMAMARLSKLAAIYEKTRQMEWTIFDRTPVDQMITEVKRFINKEDATLDNIGLLEDDPNAQRDRFHCIEAWRHAILLYTYRVFTRQQNPAGVRAINYLARVTLDHVRCISRRSFIQKQVLLPVFLAGSEVGDEQDRSFIREYCRHWSAAARFYMFESTRFLLEEIWKDWDLSTRDSYWWGLKVGSSNAQRTNGEVNDLTIQVLLG